MSLTVRKTDVPTARRSSIMVLQAAQSASRALARHTDEAIGLQRRLASKKQCAKCEKKFESSKRGTKIYCRRCGEVFCTTCCSRLAPLPKYHSKFGILKNRTSKSFPVCVDCFAIVDRHGKQQTNNGSAPRTRSMSKLDAELNPFAADLADLTAATSAADPSSSLPSPPPDGHSHHHGDGHATRRPHRASIIERVHQRVRARTIEKYVESVSHAVTSKAEETVSVMEQGIKARLEAAVQQEATLEESLNRARRLRELFFQGTLPEIGRHASGIMANVVPTTTNAQQGDNSKLAPHSSNTPSGTPSSPDSTKSGWTSYLPSFPWFSSSSSPNSSQSPQAADELEALLEQEFEQQEKALETLMAHSEARKRENEIKLKESERQLEKSRLEQIARVRHRLKEAQDSKISKAVANGQRVDTEMRAHAKQLELAIKNGHHFETDLSGSIIDLREELRSMNIHLDQLEVETIFPHCMRWKIRSKVEDGLFVGIRDLDLERFDAKFSIKTGDKKGQLLVHVFDFKSCFAVYELMIRGSSARAKVLNVALTPTAMNSVTVEATGEWMMPLIFEPGGSTAYPAPCWLVDKESAFFRIKLSKTASGAFTSMPDSMLQFFASTVIPNLLETQIMQNLPTRHLGQMLTRSQNTFSIRGSVQIHGDGPRLWKAPLVGPTAASEAARQALGVSEEEAALLDYCLRSTLAHAAGFDRSKPVSLLSLHTFRLSHASHPLTSLAPMLAVVEAGVRTLKIPPNWTLQLLKRVDELATKPVDVRVQIYDVGIDLETKELVETITGLYLLRVEQALEQEKEKDAARRLLRQGQRVAASLAAGGGGGSSGKSLDAGAAEMMDTGSLEGMLEMFRNAREAAQRTVRWHERVFVPLLQDTLQATCNFMVAGGQGGVFALSFSDVLGDLRLAEKWTFAVLLWESPYIYEGFNLKVNGAAGPNAGEYTMRFNILPVGEPTDDATLETTERFRNEDDDARVTLRNVKFELFPVGRPSGGVLISAGAIRASLLLTSLWRFVLYMTTAPPVVGTGGDEEAELLDRRTSRVATETSRALFSKSREVVKELWGSFKALPILGEDQVADDLAKITGVDPLPMKKKSSVGTAAGGGGTQDDGGTEQLMNSLFPFLRDDAYELYLDIRNLECGLRRAVSSVDGTHSVRLVVNKKNRFEHEVQCASFALRINLANVFVGDDQVDI